MQDDAKGAAAGGEGQEEEGSRRSLLERARKGEDFAALGEGVLGGSR